MSLVVDEHRQYLADDARIAAFRRAIGEMVKPGDTVLDLGAGTGILGLLACQRGASRVYCVEETGMIGLAREICRANGFQDRVVFLKELSAHVILPERVDVVVADQIGRFGFDAGIVEYFRDARARLLKPGGALIPSRIDLWVAPVECPSLREQVEFWTHRPAGFDFGPAHDRAINTGYPIKFRPDHLLGEPALLCSVDPSLAPASWSGLEADVTVAKAGTLHGVGGWFSAQLSPSVIMSNSPLAHSPINRQNVFFPINDPVKVESGDRVTIRMTIIPTEAVVRWRVEVWGASDDGLLKKAHADHSTFQGMLLCVEDLQRTQPDFVPRLSPWGEARLTVLELCDGRRTVREVEQELHRRHPGLFPSLADAAKFVAEVTTRYAQ